MGHSRAGSADPDGLGASKSKARKRSHCAWPGQVSFDERTHKLTTFTVENFGCLAKESSDLLTVVEQVASSIVGVTDGSSLTRKDV